MLNTPAFPVRAADKVQNTPDRTEPLPPPSGDVSATNAAALTSDFETFLTLLTAQMRNQDPLNPTESTEFVAQLASFSAVEQQIRSNDTLDSILQALSGGDDLVALAEWIGREVRFASSAPFEGAPLEIETTPIATAETATLVVRNDFGETVRTRPVDTIQRYVVWNGLQDDGTLAAEGDYSFTVEYSTGDEPLGAIDGRVFVPVAEVRMDGGAGVLVAPDGTQMPLSEVTAVREAA